MRISKLLLIMAALLIALPLNASASDTGDMSVYIAESTMNVDDDAYIYILLNTGSYAIWDADFNLEIDSADNALIFEEISTTDMTEDFAISDWSEISLDSDTEYSIYLFEDTGYGYSSGGSDGKLLKLKINAQQEGTAEIKLTLNSLSSDGDNDFDTDDITTYNLDVTAKETPDLIIDAITLNPNSPTEGDIATARATVKNIGGALEETDSFEVAIYKYKSLLSAILQGGSPSDETDILASETLSGSDFLDDDSETIPASWTVTPDGDSDSDYKITICAFADTENEIDEGDNENNQWRELLQGDKSNTECAAFIVQDGDDDGDGYTTDDCDDTDADIRPGAAEECDGLDNDCAASTPDGSGEAAPLNSKTAGVCAGSTKSCTSGSWRNDYSGVTGYESTETSCDGKDNDCDGETDEGCACTDGQIQACGSDVGECEKGIQTCSSGAWGACEGGIGPTTELCSDWRDNDCDGYRDRADSDCAGCHGDSDCQDNTNICATPKCTAGSCGFVNNDEYSETHDCSQEAVCVGNELHTPTQETYTATCIDMELNTAVVCEVDVEDCTESGKICSEGACITQATCEIAPEVNTITTKARCTYDGVAYEEYCNEDGDLIEYICDINDGCKPADPIICQTDYICEDGACILDDEAVLPEGLSLFVTEKETNSLMKSATSIGKEEVTLDTGKTYRFDVYVNAAAGLTEHIIIIQIRDENDEVVSFSYINKDAIPAGKTSVLGITYNIPDGETGEWTVKTFVWNKWIASAGWQPLFDTKELVINLGGGDGGE